MADSAGWAVRARRLCASVWIQPRCSRVPGSVVGGSGPAVDPLWHRLGGGCHLTRDVVRALANAALQPDWLEPVHRGGLLPVIRGRAITLGKCRPHQV